MSEKHKKNLWRHIKHHECSPESPPNQTDGAAKINLEHEHKAKSSIR